MIVSDASHSIRRARRAVLKRIQYVIKRNIRARSREEMLLLRHGPRVLANSVPKAGTNLLAQLMRMMPNIVERWGYHIDETLPGIERQLRSGQRGQVLTAHLPWSSDLSNIVRELDFRVFMMVRDPRDIAVSSVNYVTRMDLSHPLHRLFAELPDDDARLLAMIDPPSKIMDRLPEVWKNGGLVNFLPWLDEPNCMMIRFEDLVGSHGGGDDTRQRDAIRSIANHVGNGLSDASLDEISRDLFGHSGSKTFHKGQIGSWRDHFKPAHVAAFKRRSNEILLRLGYETTVDW